MGCSCIQAEAIEPMLAFQSLVATGEHRKACLSHWEGKTHSGWRALHLVIGGSKRMVWFTYLENNCPISNGHFLIFGEVERSKNGKHDKFWPICSLLIFIIMVNIVNVVNMVNMLCTVHYRVAGVAQAALDEKFGLGRKF